MKATATVAIALAMAHLVNQMNEGSVLKYGYQGGQQRRQKSNRGGKVNKMIRRRKRKGYSW